MANVSDKVKVRGLLLMGHMVWEETERKTEDTLEGPPHLVQGEDDF